MTATEIFLACLMALAIVEIGVVFAALARSIRKLRSIHDTIDAAQASPAALPWFPFPAAWKVEEKAGPLMLCDPHLEQHDQERGASFTPLAPAPAGSQCAACLRDMAIIKARTA